MIGAIAACHYFFEIILVFGLGQTQRVGWIIFLKSMLAASATLFVIKQFSKKWFGGKDFFQVILINRVSAVDFVVCGLFGLFWAGVVTFLHRFFPAPAPTEIERLFQDPLSFFAGSVYAVAFAPFFEEVVFRGILFTFFKRVSNTVIAFILVSFFFTGLHVAQMSGYWFGILSVLSVSLIATALRQRSNSITFSVLFHLAYNATVLFNFWD